MNHSWHIDETKNLHFCNLKFRPLSVIFFLILLFYKHQFTHSLIYSHLLKKYSFSIFFYRFYPHPICLIHILFIYSLYHAWIFFLSKKWLEVDSKLIHFPGQFSKGCANCNDMIDINWVSNGLPPFFYEFIFTPIFAGKCLLGREHLFYD